MSAVGPADDRPTLDLACLDPRCRRAALVSTGGNHCEVWRGSRKKRFRSGRESYTEFVIKFARDRYSEAETRVLARQYQLLRDALGSMVPKALFVRSCIDGEPNLVVLARAVNVWFNIANPANREEAIGLLRENGLARAQLRRFLRVAQEWRQGPNPRVVDLYGLDNLVMDNRRRIRFIDSFYPFYFEDMLHILGGERDFELEEKIRVSLSRLAYLDDILAAADVAAVDGRGGAEG